MKEIVWTDAADTLCSHAYVRLHDVPKVSTLNLDEMIRSDRLGKNASWVRMKSKAGLVKWVGPRGPGLLLLFHALNFIASLNAAILLAVGPDFAILRSAHPRPDDDAADVDAAGDRAEVWLSWLGSLLSLGLSCLFMAIVSNAVFLPNFAAQFFNVIGGAGAAATLAAAAIFAHRHWPLAWGPAAAAVFGVPSLVLWLLLLLLQLVAEPLHTLSLLQEPDKEAVSLSGREEESPDHRPALFRHLRTSLRLTRSPAAAPAKPTQQTHSPPARASDEEFQDAATMPASQRVDEPRPDSAPALAPSRPPARARQASATAAVPQRLPPRPYLKVAASSPASSSPLESAQPQPLADVDPTPTSSTVHFSQNDSSNPALS